MKMNTDMSREQKVKTLRSISKFLFLLSNDMDDELEQELNRITEFKLLQGEFGKRPRNRAKKGKR